MGVAQHLGVFEYWGSANVSAGLDNITAQYQIDFSITTTFLGSLYLGNGCFGKLAELYLWIWSISVSF